MVTTIPYFCFDPRSHERMLLYIGLGKMCVKKLVLLRERTVYKWMAVGNLCEMCRVCASFVGGLENMQYSRFDTVGAAYYDHG